MRTTVCLIIGVMLWGSAAGAENVIRWTSQGDALTLDPHAVAEGATIAMSGQIYERLVNRDATLALEPDLARSWRLVEPTIWEFSLREGVRFHDGASFTAEDVVFSVGRAKSETSNFRRRLQSVVRVDAVDDHTVQIITARPNPILPSQLTSIFMMDKDWAETHGVEVPLDYGSGDETYAVLHANGTGPFVLVSRAPNIETVLRRNEHWWGFEAYPHNIDRVIYTPISNGATRLAALMSGEVDFVLDPPLQDVERLRAQEGLKVLTVAQDRTIFFGLDQGVSELRSSQVSGRNPLADARVRRAMLLALDADAVRDVTMRGLSDPAGIVTSPVVHGYSEELDTRPAVDIAAAQALLAEAGYPDGFDIQLDCPNDRYINDESICTAAGAMFSKIGIAVHVEARPKSQHFPRVSQGLSDFYLLGWGVSTLDSHIVFDALVHSDGVWNRTGYSNPKIDSLIEEIGVEVDTASRDAMIAEVWRTIKDDVVYLPIHHQMIVWAMSDRLDIPIAANDSPQFKWARMH